MFPKLVNFLSSYEKEMANIREQNYYLNRQFNENLNEMRAQARELSNQRTQINQELALLRRREKAEANRMDLSKNERVKSPSGLQLSG